MSNVDVCECQSDLVRLYEGQVRFAESDAMRARFGKLLARIRSGDPAFRHATACPEFVEWRDLKSFVYFIQVGEHGAIKIGKSDRPDARRNALQTGHHEELRLLGWARGGEPLEQALHADFEEYRIRGEWFRPDARLVATIRILLRREVGPLAPTEATEICATTADEYEAAP